MATIKQPIHEIAISLVDLLIKQIEHDEIVPDMIHPVSLLERETTRKPNEYTKVLAFLVETSYDGVVGYTTVKMII